MVGGETFEEAMWSVLEYIANHPIQETWMENDFVDGDGYFDRDWQHEAESMRALAAACLDMGRSGGVSYARRGE